MATRALLGLAVVATHTANAHVPAVSDATPTTEDNATATTPWATDNVIYTAIATLIGIVVIAGPVVGTVIGMINRTPSDTADREKRGPGRFGENLMDGL